MNRYRLFAACLLAGLIGMAVDPAPAKATGDLSACTAIDDKAARLRCYDEAAGFKPKERVAPAAAPPAQSPPAAASRPSHLSQVWQLDKESRRSRGRFAITPYKQNYMLLYSYNFTQDKQTYEAANPGTEIKEAEAKYQISLKTNIWPDIFGTKLDLWAAYTQLSLWQLYNTKFSSPFRETNYEPELILNYRTDADLFGLLKNRFIQVGLNHQSNGRGEPLSRSWNRIIASLGFERDDFNLVLKTWARIPESESQDDNRDIVSYLGYGEIWAATIWRDYHLALMFRNNLRFDENRSALQFEVSFPLTQHLNGYLQYFTGYGESLIDYNHYTNRFGIGVMVKDW